MYTRYNNLRSDSFITQLLLILLMGRSFSQGFTDLVELNGEVLIFFFLSLNPDHKVRWCLAGSPPDC